MLVAKKKAVGHVLSIFKGQSSSTMKYSQVQLGSVEGNDLLGVSLHKEATTGSRRSLKKVLHSAKCVDFPNNLGQTPLFCACARNNEGTALLLLEYGANPNEKSQNGMTPTHAACFMGNVCLLRKLIEAGGDLRLHDTDGAGMREWALRNTEPKRRGRMLEFLNKTHLFAMTYSGDTASRDQLIRFGRRQHMKTSLLELMKQRSSHDSGVKSLQRVKSMGFGKVYLGSDHDGGLMSIIPLVSEALLFVTNSNCFDCGYNTFIEEMEWMNTPVSVKQVKPDALTEDGIDLLISDAEQLGKLRHPNILLLMGICQPSCLDNIMVLLERINYATLYHLLHETKRKLLTSQKMNLVHQMCGAMEFIHSQNLIHCGLSSMAVYLVSIGLAKIGNLEFMVEGLKAELGKLSAVSQVSHRGFLYNWMSPELMQARPPCYSSDVYSFCSVLWEMFAEQVPWSGAEAEEILHSVVEEKTSLDLNVAKVPEKLKAILGYGLEIKEDLRLNKFSFIANWLKADSTLDPQFQKGPLKSSKQNHSGNRTGSESSSTTSSQSAIRDTVREMGWGRSDLQFMDRCDPAKLSDTDIDKVSLQGFSKEDLPTPLSRTNTCGTYCADPGNLLYMHGWSCEQEQQVGDDRPLYRSSPALMNTAVVGPGTLSHPGKSLVRPASHMDPAMHGYPGTGWGPSLGFGRNNNGKPSAHEQTRSVTLPRSFLSQPQLCSQSQSRSCDAQTRRSSVRQLALSFQQQLEQHKLRQAILKGSMARSGKQPDTNISDESFEMEKMEGIRLGRDFQKHEDVGPTRDVVCPGALYEVSTSLTPTCIDSSTPKSGSQTGRLPMLLQAKHNEFCPSDIGPCHKVLRDVGTGSADVNDSSESKLQTPELTEKRGEKNWLMGKGQLLENSPGQVATTPLINQDCFMSSDVFLQEMKCAQTSFLRRKVVLTESGGTPGVQYESPTVEVHAEYDHEEHEQNRVVGEIIPPVCGNSSPQISPKSSVRDACVELPPDHLLEPSGTDENDSFWNVTHNVQCIPIKDKAGNFGGESEKTECVYEISAKFPEGVVIDCKMSQSTIAKARDSSEKCSEDSKNAPEPRADRQWSQSHLTEESSPNDLTHTQMSSQCSTLTSSLVFLGDAQKGHEEKVLDSTFSMGEEGNDDDILDKTFTVAERDEGPSKQIAPSGEDPAKHLVNTEDLEVIERWVDDKLARIEHKMKIAPPPSGSKELQSLVSTVGLGDDTSAPSIAVVGSEVGPVNPGGHSNVTEIVAEDHSDILACTKLVGGGDSELLKINSAKSVPELDGCDFEFQEFYIDDDFDSFMCMPPEAGGDAEAAVDSNRSTRIYTSWSGVPSSDKSAKGDSGRCDVKHQTGKPPSGSRVRQKVATDINLNRGKPSPGSVEMQCASVECLYSIISTGDNQNISESHNSMDGKTANLFPLGNGICNLLGSRVGVSDPDLSISSAAEWREDQAKVMLEKDSKIGEEDDDTLCGHLVADVDLSNAREGSTVEKGLGGNGPELAVSSAAKSRSGVERSKSGVERLGTGVNSLKTSIERSRSGIERLETSFERSRSGVAELKSSVDRSRSDSVRCAEVSERNRGTGAMTVTSQTQTENIGQDRCVGVPQQTSLSTHSANREVEREDSESTDSDMWIKKNLKRIQSKILRRRRRLKYVVSSDEESNFKDGTLDTTNMLSSTSSYVGMMEFQMSDKRSYTDNQGSGIYPDEMEPLHTEICHLEDSCRKYSPMSKTTFDGDESIVLASTTAATHRNSKNGRQVKDKLSTKFSASKRSQKLMSSRDVQQTVPRPRDRCLRKNLKGQSCSLYSEKKDPCKGIKVPQDCTNLETFQDLDAEDERKDELSDEETKSERRRRSFHSSVVYHGHRKSLADNSSSSKEPQPSVLERPDKSRSSSRQGPVAKPRSSLRKSPNSREEYSQESSNFRDTLEKTLLSRLDKRRQSQIVRHRQNESCVEEAKESSVRMWIANHRLGEGYGRGLRETPENPATKPVQKTPDRPLWKSGICRETVSAAAANAVSSSHKDRVDAGWGSVKDIGEGIASESLKMSEPGGVDGAARKDETSNRHRFTSVGVSSGKCSLEVPGSDGSGKRSKKTFGKRGAEARSRSLDLGDGVTVQQSGAEHCLTLDLRPEEELLGGGTGNKLRKKSSFGLHRFYIPRDVWPGGCKARLNVHVDPTDPKVHRVTGTAMDPTSGHSEVLIDQTLVTKRLRSTLQMD